MTYTPLRAALRRLPHNVGKRQQNFRLTVPHGVSESIWFFCACSCFLWSCRARSSFAILSSAISSSPLKILMLLSDFMPSMPSSSVSSPSPLVGVPLVDLLCWFWWRSRMALRSSLTRSHSQSTSFCPVLMLFRKYVCFAPSPVRGSIWALTMEMELFLKVAVISDMIIGISFASVMKNIVHWLCRSLLKPISSLMATLIMETSSDPEPPCLCSRPSTRSAASPPSIFMAARWFLACWWRRQYCTASFTVGKNHWSPMNFFSLALRIVLSTRFPTIAKAVWMPRLRKSETMSWMMWTAVESRLMTGVISRIRYSVLLTSSRSFT
mmetsp:Transcript_40213/g.87676  ORF Transcript_40213/g.87676 Transcript_40213/m.87676 type:complete len:324 (-) Transcript_40213:840-1811(-)